MISMWKNQRSYCKSLVGHGGMSPPTKMNYAITRTTSIPPTMADNVVSAVKPKETMLSSNRGREIFKKRKADKNQHLKVCSTSIELVPLPVYIGSMFYSIFIHPTYPVNL